MVRKLCEHGGEITVGEITSVLRILKLRKTTFYDLITNKHTKHGGDTLKKKMLP